MKVRVALGQKDRRIVPDMGVRVSFLSAPTAPGAPPGRRGGRARARLRGARRGQGRASSSSSPTTRCERRSVTLGQSVGPDRQVLSGLSAGERVVLSPPATLGDGDAVKLAAGS